MTTSSCNHYVALTCRGGCYYGRYGNLLGWGSDAWTAMTAWRSSGSGTHDHPCTFSVASVGESLAPHRCLKKFISMSITFFASLGCTGEALKFISVLEWVHFLFFSFLNTFLAAKETWCRKSSSDSLHMAPVAKATTEDACRPPCSALKCSCTLGGLRSMWVKRLWRKQSCYFSFCLISWKSLAFRIWDWFPKIIMKRVSAVFP